jgi:hypothetical protein
MQMLLDDAHKKNVSHMLYGVTDRNYFPGLDACFSFSGVSVEWKGQGASEYRVSYIDRSAQKPHANRGKSSALTGCSFV